MAKRKLFSWLFISLLTLSACSTQKTAVKDINQENTITDDRKRSEFSFSLIGDLPYGLKIKETDSKFRSLINQINADPEIDWVLHVGDIKHGATSCTERFLSDRKRRFDSFTPAFILTPGDNEWTDCHRLTAGNFDPLSRLDVLRSLFFSEGNHKLEQNVDILQKQADMQITHAAYHENILWQKNNVVFSTIHLVGSLNGHKALPHLKPKQKTALEEEIKARTNAAIAWLDHTFEHSHREKAKGVFVAIHANPGFDTADTQTFKEVYGEFLEALRKGSKKFGRPVVLAHGDSHTFRIDQPSFFGKEAPDNFIRVETFGDSNGSWIKVEVKPESHGVFSFSAIRN